MLEIISGTVDFYLEKETAVAMGKFDGIHTGHRRLLEEVLEQKEKGLKACVFTFDPSPNLLFGLSDNKMITTREEKRRLFERMGIDILIEFPLTFETASIPPEKFVVDCLARQMNARFIAAGTDLSFGDGGRGDANLLRLMAPDLGMEVKTIDKVCVDGIEVSSSLIRTKVEAGDMEAVERFLGMPYPVMGTVVHGNHVGSGLGFPTVNLLPEADKLLPPNGVYESEVFYRGKRLNGISNVGYKPTVTAERLLGVETYLYDFSEDIYGEYIEVYLKSFRRPEKRFADLSALKAQLLQDIEGGRPQKGKK